MFQTPIYADMAESADALDSGSSGSNTVCVQVTLSAPSFMWKKDILLSNGVSKGFEGIYLAQISEVYSIDIFERFLRQKRT